MGKFIKTHIELVNMKEVELTGVERVMYGELIFELNQVAAIRETIIDDESEPDPKRCGVYLKTGEYFNIFTPYKEIAKLFMEYHG